MYRAPPFFLFLFLLILFASPVQARPIEDAGFIPISTPTPEPPLEPPKGVSIWEKCNGKSNCTMEGYFSQYNENPTVAQREYAIKRGFIPANWDGILIAVVDCSRVGSVAWIDLGDGVWQPAYIFDCGGSMAGIHWFHENRILAEVDYYTTVRYGMVHKGGWSGRLSFSPISS